MGCNCKANDHIIRVKRKFEYNEPIRSNVTISNKIKMIFQAILIWFMLILILPIFVVVLIFSKIFKKDLKILKKIKIRL